MQSGTRASVGRERLRYAVLAVGAAFCLTPWASPQIALALGIGVALTGLAAATPLSSRVARLLIQACVVLLGFAMDLGEVLRAGTQGMIFAAATIVGTFALGAAAGRLLRVEAKVTTLVSAGTAVCGGSAIAAVGSAIGAAGAQMSIAIGVVFLLNGAALYIFPIIGRALAMSAEQFGTWAAVAIHDVSSVVGAASEFGPESLQIATAVKLSRTLWIIPIAIAAAWWFGRRGGGEGERGARRLPIPWFIGLFVCASALRTLAPAVAEAAPTIHAGAKAGMTLALFLIGAGVSRAALASVGWRALALGVLLWAFISAAALAVVRWTIA